MEKPEVPPEPEVADRYWLPQVEHHATAIGYICIALATVEFEVDRLIQTLLGCPEPIARAICTKTGSLENRLELLRHIASEGSPAGDWPARLNHELKELSEALKERNRVVHDTWIEAEEPTQIDRRSRMGRSKDKPIGEKLPPRSVPRKLEDLWSLQRRILNLGTSIRILQIQCVLPMARTPPREGG